MSIQKSIPLQEAIKLFKFEAIKTNTNLLGNSANMIYEIEQNDEHFILRITHKPAKHIQSYEGEIDFINYLHDNGVGVSRPISSVNNRFVEHINIDNSCFLVSAFEKAQGKIPDTKNNKIWNKSLFYKWGNTMGQMHSLAKEYKIKDISMKRKEWNEDIYFTNQYSLPQEEAEVIRKWKGIIEKLELLPKDKSSYGIIHNDFHHHNFFVSDGNITVFDFDDCLYHWFAYDITIALYHAVHSIPKTETQNRINFAHQFVESFLNGYLKENIIDDFWIKNIPLFLDYRRICSFMFFWNLWSFENINEVQKKYLLEMKRDIENDNPVINIDINKIITKTTNSNLLK